MQLMRAPNNRRAQTPLELLSLASRNLRIKAAGIIRLESGLGQEFVAAVDSILARSARVVVTRTCESSHIATTIGATLASTVTLPYFMHPAETTHGRLGMMTADDVLLALSSSGESTENPRLLAVSSTRAHG
jgi:arabinose-5-phosphate isomerase